MEGLLVITLNMTDGLAQQASEGKNLENCFLWIETVSPPLRCIKLKSKAHEASFPKQFCVPLREFRDGGVA